MVVVKYEKGGIKMEKVLDVLSNDARIGIQQIYAETMQKRNKEFEETQARLSALLHTLNEQQTALFYSWKKAEANLQTQEMESAYKQGIKTGVDFMMEVYDFNV